MLRIVPAVFLYLVILRIFLDLPWKAFALNMLFISNYFYDGLGVGTGHLWSLCVEVHFYLAIGLLVWLFGRQAVWLVVPAAMIVTSLRIDTGVVSNINTHLRLDEILVGGLLALISMKYGDRLRQIFAQPWIPWTVLTLAALLFFISSHSAGGVLTYFRPYFTMCLVGVIIHSNLGGVTRLLEGRIAAYTAKISYALYIYHPLMIVGWMNTGSTMERYLFKRPISYALTWISAHLSSFVWEKYWQTKAREWAKYD